MVSAGSAENVACALALLLESCPRFTEEMITAISIALMKVHYINSALVCVDIITFSLS